MTFELKDSKFHGSNLKRAKAKKKKVLAKVFFFPSETKKKENWHETFEKIGKLD